MVSQFGQCTYFNFIIDYNIIVSQIHTIKEPLLIPREGGGADGGFLFGQIYLFHFQLSIFQTFTLCLKQNISFHLCVETHVYLFNFLKTYLSTNLDAKLY